MAGESHEARHARKRQESARNGPGCEAKRVRRLLRFLLRHLGEKPVKIIVAASVGVVLGAGGASTPVVSKTLSPTSSTVDDRLEEALTRNFSGCLAQVEEGQEQRAEDLESLQRRMVFNLERLHNQELSDVARSDYMSNDDKQAAQTQYEQALAAVRKDYESELNTLKDRSKSDGETLANRCEAGFAELPRADQERTEQLRTDGEGSVRAEDKNFRKRADKLDAEFDDRVDDLGEQFKGRLRDQESRVDESPQAGRTGGGHNGGSNSDEVSEDQPDGEPEKEVPAEGRPDSKANKDEDEDETGVNPKSDNGEKGADSKTNDDADPEVAQPPK